MKGSKHPEMVGWCLIAVLLLAAILLPFATLGSTLTDFTTKTTKDVRSSRAICALVIISLVTDIFLPIPSSTVAIASGSLLGPALGVVANWVGLSLGSLLGYGLGRYGGWKIGQRLVGSQGLDRAHKCAEDYGVIAVAICRPLAVLAEASAIVLGMSKMSLLRYLLVSGASNLVIATVYSLTGAWVITDGSMWVVIVTSMLAPLPVWLVYQHIATAHSSRRVEKVG
ncbi:MAG TPA: VTT domain-containing protein [Candidatus Entotheonella sp.]